MILLETFDPTNPSSGQFNLNLTGGKGKAVIYNESNSNLKLVFSNNYSSYLPAWTAVMYCFTGIPLTNPLVSYSTVSTLQGVVSTTISQVAIEIYEVNEPVGGTYPAALIRQLSVGNAVNSTTTTNQVTNDGNPTVTTFIESTQSGNTSGSNVAIGNDGSAIFAQFVAATLTKLFQVIPNGTSVLKLGATGLQSEVLGSLLFDQNPIVTNNTSLQFKDSGGTARKVLNVDGSNNTTLSGISGTENIQCLKSDGSVKATIDTNNGLLNMACLQQVINGDTSGTMTVTEMFSGPFKMVLVSQNNFRQNGGAVNVTLHTAFTSVVGAWTLPNLGGIQLAIGGVAQTITIFTGFGTGAASGSTTTATQMNGSNFGGIAAAITQIGTPGGQLSAHTSAGYFFGI